MFNLSNLKKPRHSPNQTEIDSPTVKLIGNQWNGRAPSIEAGQTNFEISQRGWWILND